MKQQVSVGVQVVSTTTDVASSRGGRLRTWRLVAWAGPASKGSRAETVSDRVPAMTPAAGAPDQGTLQVTHAVPCRSSSCEQSGSPAIDSERGSPSSSTHVERGALAT